ncbi:MAG TPA: hypothetical protein VN711_00615 [Candidatus Saccharimonadales bacterium]|nr:hypothetical protein [Candidatus Saccharimonadales bacterium]
MSTEIKKVSLDEMVIKSLYYRYKDFLTPFIVIVVCLITIWIIILPQIQGWFTMQGQISDDTQKLTILKQNLNAISVMNDTSLNTMLGIATSALPVEKDVTGIVNALDTAALKSGTQIGDYNFQIGNIAGVDPNAGVAIQQNTLQLVVTVPGNLVTMKNFVANLRNELPLSDVKSLSINQDSTVTVTVVFYYALLPKITFDDTAPLQLVTGKDQQFLENLGGIVSPTPSLVAPTPVVTNAPKITPISPLTTPGASNSASQNASGSAQ